MKKIFKFRTILIAIITVLSFMFLFSVDNITVNAEEGYGRCTNTEGALYSENGACKEDDTIWGSLTITKGGMINVVHNYGITEFLIYAEQCADMYVGTDGKVDCRDNASSWAGKKVIIHGSGNRTTGSKTAHLYKYFEEGSLVRVKVIYEFIGEQGGENKKFGPGNTNTANSGKYNPVYCDLNIARYECGKYYTNPDNSNLNDWDLIRNRGESKSDVIKKYSITERIKLLGVTGKYTVEKLDRNGIVYQGSGLNNSLPFGSVFVVVENTSSYGAKGDFDGIVYDTIIPALLIVLGIAATITVVVLGVQIIKGADEASERSDKIKKLRGILIGLAIAFAALAVIEPIAELVSKYMEQQ